MESGRTLQRSKRNCGEGVEGWSSSSWSSCPHRQLFLLGINRCADRLRRVRSISVRLIGSD